ncbi:3-hydroxyisobutyrate dehydrogenase [Salsuginibacillus halophilus]|uniref:3-hydroxyisobutyrate dehydrogenase n=1 Tax=Salsuginibacillus halophilus TaxID=517424 RepID=A0A2P8HXG7_9BACI|nr:NAD(P)-dependent oxidoreductase [Salsuginibacillus halophilus]PSL50919.1 3-hydroxyisobutyrate dehydrogenase [Salsuginibacillus halophilus]
MKIVFIGLGNMGMPMAKNLVAAGHDVYGFNRSQEKVDRFVQAGGLKSLSIQEAAADADAVFTCLPKPEDVASVVLKEADLCTHMRKGALLIDLSTTSLDVIHEIHRTAETKEVAFMDAPVSGGTTGAEAATLTVMTGGSRQAFEQALPLLSCMGSHVHYTGEVGSGTKIKLLNQYFVGMHTLAVSEAMVMAEAVNVDQQSLYDILSSSFAQSKIYDRHYQQFIAKDDYEPGFALELLLKDLNLTAGLDETLTSTLQGFQSAKEAFHDAASAGFHSRDMSGLYPFLQQEKGNS